MPRTERGDVSGAKALWNRHAERGNMLTTLCPQREQVRRLAGATRLGDVQAQEVASLGQLAAATLDVAQPAGILEEPTPLLGGHVLVPGTGEEHRLVGWRQHGGRS